jgi:hypothetical protein
MRTDLSGRGILSILKADQLIQKPRLHSTFLLWLLSELYENLPEVFRNKRRPFAFSLSSGQILRVPPFFVRSY